MVARRLSVHPWSLSVAFHGNTAAHLGLYPSAFAVVVEALLRAAIISLAPLAEDKQSSALF